MYSFSKHTLSLNPEMALFIEHRRHRTALVRTAPVTGAGAKTQTSTVIARQTTCHAERAMRHEAAANLDLHWGFTELVSLEPGSAAKIDRTQISRRTTPGRVVRRDKTKRSYSAPQAFELR